MMEAKEQCSICEKPVDDENWCWNEETAHKICVVETAEVACDDMTCFSMTDEYECIDGLKFKTLTKREKKALLK